MKKIFFLLALLILNSQFLISIEVGGHLTENTIWSPENNPYLVTENLYVDSGVTLTIEPGTIVKIGAAPLTSYYDSNENFWLYNGDSVAKMIWVNGRIIAEGTEQDSIVFDRIQDDINYNWGSIYMTENAELSIFKHCIVQNAAGIWVAVSVPTKGLCFASGKGIVNHCTFINNGASIYATYSSIKDLEITDNDFIINDEVNPFYPHYNYGRIFIVTCLYGTDSTQKTLICNNNFYGIPSYTCLHSELVYFYNNKVINCNSSLLNRIGYFYDNEFINCETGIEAGHDDTLYVKNNRFIGGNNGIDVDDTYVEISDNYFEGCGISSTFALGVVKNNIMYGSRMWVAGDLEVLNNIAYNSNSYGIEAGYNPYISNNISINNGYAIWSATNTYENSIIIQNAELSQFPINGNPTFRNCIIDFPLEPPLIDGGGNIIVDSLQAQSIFEDIQNGDFHLAPGSIAIDAGFDTTGYYYPFDLDYSQRVWDGNGDGNAIIDIGPYEFGAPQLGKITGNITESESGEPVDYVFLKINNEPGNFTFADSSGHFEMQLPAGTYDIYAERVFYENNIIGNVTVENEQTTEVNFNMTSTLPPVSIDDGTIPHTSLFTPHLSNYPNPFNPTTTISFDLAQASNVSLIIYNIKGQKVKTLTTEFLKEGTHSVVWNGKNNSNKSVASGLYFYKLTSGKDTVTHKMLLLK